MPANRIRYAAQAATTRTQRRAELLCPEVDTDLRGGLASTAGPAQLEIRERCDIANHRHVVSLGGEVDVTNSARVETWVAEIVEAGTAEMIIEISGLWFIDARGLRALVSCRELCHSNGVSFALTPATGTIKRVFAITGLEEMFDFRDA